MDKSIIFLTFDLDIFVCENLRNDMWRRGYTAQKYHRSARYIIIDL